MSLRAARAALLSLPALLWPAPADGSPHAPRADSACKLVADSAYYLSSGFGYDGDCAPSTGELAGFMLFVDFADAPATEASPQELHDFFLPAAADWYAQSSYGALALNVTADASAFVRMPGDAASYNWGRDGFTTEIHKKYVDDAVAAYTDGGRRRLPSVDVLYVVPTAAAADIGFSPTYNSRVSTPEGTLVAKRAVTFGLDAYDVWGFKTLNHETGHCMCLADYYPFDGPTGQYVGGWDMMGLIGGPSPDYFAWDKWRLGWLEDSAVACVSAKGSSRHVLTPLAASGSGVKAVVVATSATTALVAEARTAAGLDANNCAPGVLLYTVSTVVATGEGPIRVVDANPDTDGCDDEPLNDATLNMNGTQSYTVPDFGVTVAILEQTDSSFTIQVDYE